MAELRHMIGRQVIEIDVRDSARARRIQDELSGIYRRRIVPLFERCFDELGNSDRFYRIDSLVLDLGTVDPLRLEDDFARKAEAALRRELSKLIDACDASEKTTDEAGLVRESRSRLELFAFFARTGCLPWWADASRPGLLAENLEGLLHEAPGGLISPLRDLMREPAVHRRLIAHYSDDSLAALCGLLLSADAERVLSAVHECVSALAEERLSSADSRPLARRVFWGVLLEAAAAGGDGYPGFEALCRAARERAETAACRSEAASAPAAAGTFEPAVDQSVGEDYSTAASFQPGPAAADAPRAPDSVRHAAPGEGPELSPGWSSTGLSAGMKLIPPAAEKPHRPEDPASKTLPFPGISSFGETDALSVHNAGIVILWPFLDRFFDRLDLLDGNGRGRNFRSPMARHRAAGLLQAAAGMDPASPEYLLPLNKMLCGIGITDVYEFGPPMLEGEVEECGNLIGAVIAQAPVLRDMSPEGFRGSFLLRGGILRVGDGIWLLRAERRSYDIVLDRFPWSWEWIKFPWMEAPLRVEW